jgi:hypothetical protein
MSWVHDGHRLQGKQQDPILYARLAFHMWADLTSILNPRASQLVLEGGPLGCEFLEHIDGSSWFNNRS